MQDANATLTLCIHTDQNSKDPKFMMLTFEILFYGKG